MAVAFGRYELLKKIASGGMGQVFLARTATQGFAKLVVIKRILPHLVEDAEFISMFFDEAQIAARLNHPNLIQIFDMGEVNGSNYLAMEYVAGEDLRRVDRYARRRGQPLPLGLACRIVADAAAALDYAHKVKDPHGTPLHLIHRDVSPQNILVGFDGGVKLIDFGVAKATGRLQKTATGMLKGKYPYMSPEQIAGDPYDHRSDQFALGVVLWELLTGRRLFKGDSDLVTMRLVRECVVPLPSNLDPALPSGLDAIVTRVLARNPEDRFPDTDAFRMALEDFAIAHALPASAAHLSSAMRELYAERIARESDIAALDELTERSSLGESTVASLSPRAPSPADATRAAEVAQQPAPPQTQSVDRPPKPRGGRVLAVAGAAALLGAGGAFLLIEHEAQNASRRDSSDVSAEPTVAQVQAQAPASASAPLRLVSTPAGAEVTVDGKRIGTTPLEFTLARATTAEAVFTLEGHEDGRATLTSDSGPVVEVALERKEARRSPVRKPDTSALGIKTGR